MMLFDKFIIVAITLVATLCVLGLSLLFNWISYHIYVKSLFWFMCIPVRFLLAMVAYYNVGNLYLSGVAAGISAAARPRPHGASS